jgi:hypothetical protein
MKLFSSLRYTSHDKTPAGTGNHGGDLRLFFTLMNAADFTVGPPFRWNGGGAAADTYKLPNGDTIALNLILATVVPGNLFVQGSIHVTLANGNAYGPVLGQQPAQVCAPGLPTVSFFKGRSLGASGGTQFDVGFEMAVPWDGASADCHGCWWAVWH